MKVAFAIRVFNTDEFQWLFVLENEVLELFNLIDGKSERCHVSAIRSFEWEVDRKGRFQHVIKTHKGVLALQSLHISFSTTPEISEEANAFREKVMDAAKNANSNLKTSN